MFLKNSGKCLDIAGGPSAVEQGTPAIQWTCWGGSNQKFQLTPVEGGYKITAQHSGLQLDLAGIGTDDDAPVIQWTCWGGDKQKWSFVQTQ